MREQREAIYLFAKHNFTKHISLPKCSNFLFFNISDILNNEDICCICMTEK